MYLVEVIFERIMVVIEDDVQVPELKYEVYTVQFEKRNEALQKADTIQRVGIKSDLNIGSTVRLLIPPGSIKQIAVIDYEKLKEEQAILEPPTEQS